MRPRTRKFVLYLALPVFGIALGLGIFWAAENYFWGGSIRGARTVTALSRQLLGRDPTPEELTGGIALWRRSPDELFKAAREYAAELKGQGGYGMSFVDQSGRMLSRPSGPLKVMLDPFTIYANLPNQRAERFTIDEHGFRAMPLRPGKPRIVVFGGSAAFGYLLPSDDVTFPWLLAQRFSDFEVVNAGVVGYLSGQELAQMIHRLDQLRPAAYIVFDGWNDLFDQDVVLRRASNLFGFNNQFFDMQKRLYDYHTMTGGRASQPRDAGGASRRFQDERAYLQAVREAYVTNLSKMHAFAIARGARFMAVFQPELGNKRFPSDDERMSLEAWNTLYKYMDRQFPAKYAQMARHAKDYCDTAGIPFSDPQQEPELRDERETLFYDPPHLNERGQILVTNVLERRLRTLLRDMLPSPTPG